MVYQVLTSIDFFLSFFNNNIIIVVLIKFSYTG